MTNMFLGTHSLLLLVFTISYAVISVLHMRTQRYIEDEYFGQGHYDSRT